MSLAVFFHFLCAQHVSDINKSVIRLKPATHTTQTQPHQISNTQRTENKTTDVVIQQQSQAPDDGYINVRNTLSA